MAHFRLSTDILSPLHSDISLNDGSVFSFGSLPGTPDFDIAVASPLGSNVEKDIDIDFLCTKTIIEATSALDAVTNGIKKLSNSNAEKEEKIKETYAKASDSSVSSTALKNTEIEKSNQELKVHSKINAVKVSKNLRKATLLPNLGNISDRKLERRKKGSSIIDRAQKTNHPSKNTCSLKKSMKSNKNKNEVHLKNDTDVNKEGNTLPDKSKIKNSKISLSREVIGAFETEEITSKVLLDETKKQQDSVKKFHFKSQKKIPVLSDMPTTEHRNISTEKSIQLAVDMEMENLRRFVWDQDMNMRKELLKLQEMSKRQNEVTRYMFSVINDLLEANKKLISNYK